MIFDDRPCDLGEGAFWHPDRGQLYWFDITAGKLLTRTEDGPADWAFDGPVSAAGWIDRDTLLVAKHDALLAFDVTTGTADPLAPLEAEDPRTRCNDGRADPFGGFWIGTMGRAAEPGLGAIWRYHKGQMRRLYQGLTIPNAIAFTPDGGQATFACTVSRKVLRVRLGRDGWPEGEPEVFLDLTAEGLNPDGAAIDAEGNFWSAQWGRGRVACYGPDGSLRGAVSLPAPHTSCPF